MRRAIIFILFWLVSMDLSAQSGYLGSYNSFDLKMYFAPAMHQTKRLKDDQLITNNRIFFKHYDLSYSRIVGNRLEITAGYTRSVIGLNRHYINFIDTITLISSVNPFNPSQYGIVSEKEIEDYEHQLSDVRINLNQLSFQLKFYGYGNMAPLGKYTTVGIRYGFTKENFENNIVTGAVGIKEKAGINRYTQSIISVDSISSTTMRYKHLQLLGGMGRSYPITDNLVFSIGLTVPIYTIRNTDGKWKFPIPIYDFFENDEYEEIIQTQYHDNYASYKHGSAERVMSRYATKSHWLMINVGFAWYF